jgi:hypothetical protein
MSVDIPENLTEQSASHHRNFGLDVAGRADRTQPPAPVRLSRFGILSDSIPDLKASEITIGQRNCDVDEGCSNRIAPKDATLGASVETNQFS